MNTAYLTLELGADSSIKNNEQWIQLVPTGKFSARDGRGPWELNDPESVIEATKQYAGKNLLPIDYEHQTALSVKNGQPAPAAGWITGLQARDSGIWGLVKWTDKAMEFLKNKEYKYLSPVFAYVKEGGRVTRICNAALTNSPALEMTALAKAEEGVIDDQPENTELAELTAILGLSNGATLKQIAEEVQNLKANSAGDFVPLGELERVTGELNSVNENILMAKVDEAISCGNFPRPFREVGIAMLRENEQSFDMFASQMKVLTNAFMTMQTERLTKEELAFLNQCSGTKQETNKIYTNLGISHDDIEKYGTGK